ncbi:MAG: DEAD/DEAH box helicase, partial [Cellulomonadaceae bacterium]|nr:DEAD/DEAH box helicase [Cellulomonadaceae bacterium]
MSANRYLDLLLTPPSRAERLTASREYPAKPGTTGMWPDWAAPQIVAGYRTLGIDLPWQHQTEGAEAIWAGHHVALATGTGSGKSLAFWLPALHYAATGGTVLYLSPTKALAADQLSALRRLLAATRANGFPPIQAATCDGDTPAEERQFIMGHADILLTNPDFVHYSMLPGHRRWVRFLKRLRLVIIDEGHSYRGVFGAHVSQVLRRLTRLADHYRAPAPTPAGAFAHSDELSFVVASATSADPAVSAARLIGTDPAELVAVTTDTAPTGKRTIALWQPPELPAPFPVALSARNTGGDSSMASDKSFGSGGLLASPAIGAAPSGGDLWLTDPMTLPNPFDLAAADRTPSPAQRKSATAEASELLADLARGGARTLAFTRSRRGAESVATATRERLTPKNRGKSRINAEVDLASKIAAYRGGYLPEERRELERQVRTGEILGLATTNALVLGVDITGLDAVLIAGWPGTFMSWWQQAGRAGRAGADGLVVFIARPEPLDQYLVTHSEAVFDRNLEATVFDPNNKYVIAGHLCAAAAEMHLRSEELGRFGEVGTVAAIITELTEAGVLRRRPSGWYWTHNKSAAALIDLRSAGGPPIRVVDARTGQLLGTVDSGAADSQVHKGAIYVHQGQMFHVKHL